MVFTTAHTLVLVIPKPPSPFTTGQKLHGRSHYDLRNILDSGGMGDAFVVIDEETPKLDTLWFVNPA